MHKKIKKLKKRFGFSLPLTRIFVESRWIFKPKGKKGEKSLALFPFIRTFALNQKCFTKGVTPKV
jgi:hypothetical protein